MRDIMDGFDRLVMINEQLVESNNRLIEMVEELIEEKELLIKQKAYKDAQYYEYLNRQAEVAPTRFDSN